MLAFFKYSLKLICYSLVTLLLACSDTPSDEKVFEGTDRLAEFSSTVTARYAAKQISPDILSAKLNAQESYVVFDVREADEYAVSHLKEARWVDPDISAAQFAKQFAADLQDKTAVFYCSVGVRSSQLIERLQQAGSVGPMFNLTGGIFRWHGKHLSLVNEAQLPTDSIHPYNKFWGKLAPRQQGLRYQTE